MADYVEGKRPVIEALRTDVPLKKILLADNAKRDPLVEDILRKARQKGVQVILVPRDELDQKSARGSHQGVMAETKPYPYATVTDVFKAADAYAVEHDGRTLVVVLDHITDVRNMGAIARTAECTGVSALILPDRGSPALNEDAIKTSSGALLRLPLCREQNLKTVVNLAKQYGYQIVAATEKGAVHYRTVDFRRPTLLILGNEETGISPELLKMSDVRAKLPIVGEVASLNVSVAAGVFMYEALEQRS